VAAWLVAATFIGYWSISSILASPEPYDAYARDWGFQLLMFAIFRLPFLVLALLPIIFLELFAFNRWKGPVKK
jgi:hypothetical protein